MTSSCDELGTTGNVCWKLPPSTTVFPPNGANLFSQMSRRVQSSASWVNQLRVGASSHIIKNIQILLECGQGEIDHSRECILELDWVYGRKDPHKMCL